MTFRAILVIGMSVACTRGVTHTMPAPVQDDPVAVARAALEWISSPLGMRRTDSAWVMVARPGSREFAALAAIGPVLSSEQMRPDSLLLFPEGHMRLDTLWVAGDSARFVGWFGPIPRPRQGAMLGCGQRLKLWLRRQSDASWALDPTYAVTVC